MEEKFDDEQWNVIFSYTRKQAIADGVLIDLSDTAEAREAGFIAPIVMTVGVSALVAVPAGLEGAQDLKGRLWDTVFTAAVAFRIFQGDKHLVPFEVIYQVAAKRKEKVTLWLIFNEFEGFTILLPEEY